VKAKRVLNNMALLTEGGRVAFTGSINMVLLAEDERV
jgi:hypothetical protein